MINKKAILLTAVGIVASLSIFAASVTGAPVFAAACSGPSCVTTGVNSVGNTGAGTDLSAILKKIVGVLSFVIGAVSVIMIVVGGIKYVTSNGDASTIKSAKDTILYAVVGVVVAVAAYAIVNFVVTQFVG